MRDKFYWVIRSKQKREGILKGTKQYWYFAERTGIKNKSYLTQLHFKVKWFRSKGDAEIYLMKKAMAIGPINCVVSRRKMYLDKNGKYDYWKNREALLR